MVQAGLFLCVQWFRLDCSYVFGGSGWIVLKCPVIEAGLFRLVNACSPYQLVDNTCTAITH